MSDQKTQSELALKALNEALSPFLTAEQESDIRDDLLTAEMAAKVIEMARRIKECPPVKVAFEQRNGAVAQLRYDLKGLSVSFYIAGMEQDAKGEGIWTWGATGVTFLGCHTSGSLIRDVLAHNAWLNLDFKPTAIRHLNARLV